MVQSNWVKSQLESLGHAVELIEIKTDGDVKTGPLAQIGGQGLFTKRLQEALLCEEVDLAVHSLKDLPTEDHDGLTIAAVPERENPADALVCEQMTDLQSLPERAIVGTGSVRRAAQLLHLRPDLEIRDIRGNVDTRLRKLVEEPYQAIVLACAGLNRMGLADKISFEFAVDQLLPAVGQGCLGLETRRGDSTTIDAVVKLDHSSSFARAMAERSMLRTLYAGCLSPVGAFSQVDQGVLMLAGVVLSEDGKQRVFAKETGTSDKPAELGNRVAEQLIKKGADQLLKRGD